MNLEIFKPQITLKLMSQTTFTTAEELRAINPPKALLAFLDDDEMVSITLRMQGSSFIPATYSKTYKDEFLQQMANHGLMVERMYGGSLL